MRREIAGVLGAVALVLPNANSWAAATFQATAPKKKVVVATKTFTGTPGNAGRWGTVSVALVVRKTTTTNLATKKKTVVKRITAVRVPSYPDHTDRSIFINQQAIPLLVQETLKAQSTAVNMISGATDTSEGFGESLQGALAAAKLTSAATSSAATA